MPWVQLVSDRELVYNAGVALKTIQINRRAQPLAVLSSRGEPGEQIYRFDINHGLCVAGTLEGSVYIKDIQRNEVLRLNQAHGTNVHATSVLDFDTFVTGCRAGDLKIWRYESSADRMHAAVQDQIHLQDRIWCTTGSNRIIFVGTAGCDSASVNMVDMTRSDAVFPFVNADRRRGAGVLQMQYDGAHCVLACGYDATVRMYDTRSRLCEWSWHEEYDNTLYSLAWHGDHSTFVGACRHGLVWALDNRTRRSVWSRYVEAAGTRFRDQPVHSLAFGDAKLVVALEREIMLLH